MAIDGCRFEAGQIVAQPLLTVNTAPLTHLGHRGECISLALTCMERSDPRDRVGALVTRQSHASAVVHIDGQALGLEHAQRC